MAKLKKEKKLVVDVVETPSEDVVVAPEVASAPESYLVRWTGGEERFASKSMAEFAAKTRKGGHIV